VRRGGNIHLHGDLGALGGVVDDNAGQRPYSTDTTARTIRIAASRIKIIHEGFDNAPQFEQAKGILSRSEVICFLGFGYHATNVKRLGFQSKESYKQAEIMGTSKGLTDAERGHVCYGVFNGRFAPSTNRMYSECDVLSFLRESGVLHPKY
jgi:hypothetical protein